MSVIKLDIITCHISKLLLKSTAWTLEIGTISSELQFTKQTRQVPSTCIGCIAQIPRFRAVPSFLEPCFLARNSASFNVLLGILLLCMFRASDYPCSLDHIWIGCIAQIPRFRAVPSFSKPGMFRAYDYQQCGKKI